MIVIETNIIIKGESILSSIKLDLVIWEVFSRMHSSVSVSIFLERSSNWDVVVVGLLLSKFGELSVE